MTTRRRLGARAAGLATGAVAWLAAAVAVVAADPSPTPVGGDVRTDPAAPGVVGDPLFAIVGVVVVALLAAGVTLLADRATRRG